MLIGYAGVLVKRRADARSAPFTGPSAGDVSQVWRDRWKDVDKIQRGNLHDDGCDANAGTRTFTCHIFWSAGGKHGLRESAVLSPTSYCTGTRGCMVVDNLYFTIGKAKEWGDVTLDSLWAGVDRPGMEGCVDAGQCRYLGRIADRSQTRGLAGTSRSSTPGRDLRSEAKRSPSRAPR